MSAYDDPDDFDALSPGDTHDDFEPSEEEDAGISEDLRAALDDDLEEVVDDTDFDDEAEMRLIQDLGLDVDMPESSSLDLDEILAAGEDESLDDEVAA